MPGGKPVNIEFRMTRNLFPEVAAMIDEGVKKKAEEIKEEIADEARRTVNYLSGATYDSIEVTDEGVEAGEAALFLEFGTVKMPAYPFLGPAVDVIKGQFGSLFGSIMKGKLF